VGAASLMKGMETSGNIIYADLKNAGDASKISVKEAVRNIETTLRTKNPRMPAT
jgi:hypothetical protein